MATLPSPVVLAPSAPVPTATLSLPSPSCIKLWPTPTLRTDRGSTFPSVPSPRAVPETEVNPVSGIVQ